MDTGRPDAKWEADTGAASGGVTIGEYLLRAHSSELWGSVNVFVKVRLFKVACVSWSWGVKLEGIITPVFCRFPSTSQWFCRDFSLVMLRVSLLPSVLKLYFQYMLTSDYLYVICKVISACVVIDLSMDRSQLLMLSHLESCVAWITFILSTFCSFWCNHRRPMTNNNKVSLMLLQRLYPTDKMSWKRTFVSPMPFRYNRTLFCLCIFSMFGPSVSLEAKILLRFAAEECKLGEYE